MKIHIGQGAKLTREKLGVSARELAEELEVSPQAIHQSERREGWNITKLSAYARAIGVDPHVIVENGEKTTRKIARVWIPKKGGWRGKFDKKFADAENLIDISEHFFTEGATHIRISELTLSRSQIGGK